MRPTGLSKCVTVGLVGLGAIGQSVVQFLREESGIRIAGVLVRRPGARDNPHGIRIVHSLDELLELRPDVIAELAGHSALKAYGPTILRSEIDLVITSVGALGDRDFFAALRAAATATGRSVAIVSGAIGALDAIDAASTGRLDRVTYLVRRPPDQYFPPIKSHDVQGGTEVFSGSAREAALRYPKILNVAAALGLAGIGLDRTQVSVIVDPDVETIQHEIAASGDFGELKVRIVKNKEELDSPSRLVAMSVVRALKSRSWAPLRIV